MFVATWASSSTNRVVLGYRVNNFSRRGPCQARVPFALRCPFLFVGKRSLILFREVNDLFWTPEASTLFGGKTAGKSRRNRRKQRLKNVDASGVQFCSFTSRKSIQLRFARALRESKMRAAPVVFRHGPLGVALRFARLRRLTAYLPTTPSASHQSSWAMLSRMCWQLLWKPSSSYSDRSSV